jgi:hypothetical protein
MFLIVCPDLNWSGWFAVTNWIGAPGARGGWRLLPTLFFVDFDSLDDTIFGGVWERTAVVMGYRGTWKEDWISSCSSVWSFDRRMKEIKIEKGVRNDEVTSETV